MIDEFTDWARIKKELDENGSIVKFSEGQIWWVGVGKNVGVEINGKNEDYSRPVIILKKLSGLCFWAIPLTTQPHNGSWYAEFEFRGRKQYAVVSQVRMMSVFRLYNRMGKLSKGDFNKIKTAFKELSE